VIPPVYITGTGVLCSAGSDRQALWESLTKGTRGIGPVRILDTPQKQKFFFGMLEEGSGWEAVRKMNLND
jgi:hypothetical protein